VAAGHARADAVAVLSGAVYAVVGMPVLTEPRLTRCARCYEDAAGEKGHQMFGLLIDDLGSVPMFSIIREFGRTRLLIRLRLCNACHDEAQAFALAPPPVDSPVSQETHA
jgi:hypothetical protein